MIHINESNLQDERGQSLVEVVIALAIFAFIATTVISLAVGGLTALVQGGDQTEAEAFAQEGLEATRSIRDGAWNEMTYAQSGVSISGNQWVFTGEGTQDTLGSFTRTITFSAVCRDGSYNLTSCPGSFTDLHTRLVTVNVTWPIRSGVNNTVQRISYLSNWDSREWTQDNWNGGSGQSIWAIPNKYSSDDGNLNTTNGNEVTLSSSWKETADSQVVTQRQINDIAVLSATDIWAVTDSAQFLHYTNGSWSEFSDLGSINIQALTFVSATDGWSVGTSGKIFRWNGTTWSEFTDTGNEHWNDISMTSSSLGWAVGHSGDLAKFNGTSWVESAIPSSADILAMSSLSSSNIWAAGNSGRIWNYNGSTWSLFTDTGNETWNDIFMLSATEGWVVGNSGDIRKYNGSSWSVVNSSVSRKINSVYCVASNDCWAVADRGTFLYWNGTNWASAVTTFNQNIETVRMIDSIDGWSAGQGGVILRHMIAGFYSTSGSLISSAFNMGDASPVQIISWSASVPVCTPVCSIKFQLRTAPNSGGVPGSWTSWYGADGVGSYFTNALGTLVPVALNGNQWVQYQMFLNGDTFSTPMPTAVRINYK